MNEIIKDYIDIIIKAAHYWGIYEYHPIDDPNELKTFITVNDLIKDLKPVGYKFFIRSPIVKSSSEHVSRILYLFHENLFPTKKTTNIYENYTELLKDKYGIYCDVNNLCIIVNHNIHSYKSLSSASSIPDYVVSTPDKLVSCTSAPYIILVDPVLIVECKYRIINIYKQILVDDSYEGNDTLTLDEIVKMVTATDTNDLFFCERFCEVDYREISIQYFKVKRSVFDDYYAQTVPKCINDPNTILFLCEPGNLVFEDKYSRIAGLSFTISSYEGKHV